jgi:N-formylglutamate amidohydrolase
MRSIRHIPHDSTHIPDIFRDQFLLTDQQMKWELLRMTDRHTAALFGGNPDLDVIFPVSRLLVDVERFEDDAHEPMVERGMGVFYTHTHDRNQLRRVLSEGEREELLAGYYRPHHLLLQQRVDEALDFTGRALVIDCHSFPSKRLPYEIGDDGPRAEICVGTDSFHTPTNLRDAAVKGFADAGFSVTIDTPFAGALTPLKHYGKDHRVEAIMVEVRRDLYMDEHTGARSERFEQIRSIVKNVIELLESIG